MENKRILSAIIGISQGIIGAAFGVLAVMLGLNIREVQTVFNMPPEFLPLDLLILGLFSAFSLISGLFLIREWRG
jgi:ABC-type microcin C transport system permease subunit YejE